MSQRSGDNVRSHGSLPAKGASPSSESSSNNSGEREARAAIPALLRNLLRFMSDQLQLPQCASTTICRLRTLPRCCPRGAPLGTKAPYCQTHKHTYIKIQINMYGKIHFSTRPDALWDAARLTHSGGGWLNLYVPKNMDDGPVDGCCDRCSVQSRLPRNGKGVVSRERAQTIPDGSSTLPQVKIARDGRDSALLCPAFFKSS